MKAGTIIRKKVEVGEGKPLVIDIIVKDQISPESPDQTTWVDVVVDGKHCRGAVQKAGAIFEVADCVCAEVIEPQEKATYGVRGRISKVNRFSPDWYLVSIEIPATQIASVSDVPRVGQKGVFFVEASGEAN